MPPPHPLPPTYPLAAPTRPEGVGAPSPWVGNGRAESVAGMGLAIRFAPGLWFGTHLH